MVGTSSPAKPSMTLTPPLTYVRSVAPTSVTTARWSPCAMAICSPEGNISVKPSFSLLGNLRQLTSRYAITPHERRRRPSPRYGGLGPQRRSVDGRGSRGRGPRSHHRGPESQLLGHVVGP